jgi:integrase
LLRRDMSYTKTGFEKQMASADEHTQDTDLKRNLKLLKGSEAAGRFLASYGKKRVKAQYAYILGTYVKWLRAAKGVSLSLDALIRDNLVCVWKSDPVDVDMKRRHRAWLEEYVNVHMAERSRSYRAGIASVVKGFYEKNDSPLFGKVRLAESTVAVPARALDAEEIRQVLKALPPQQRTPLLCMWQSGCEVGRMLAMNWGDLEGSSSPGG